MPATRSMTRLPVNEKPEEASPDTPLNLWDRLKQRTTAHGIPHVDSANGPAKKAFWTTLLLFTLGCLSYHGYTVISTFFGHAINVNVKVTVKRELTFPAVTLCNVNPIKKSALEHMAKTNDKLSELVLTSNGLNADGTNTTLQECVTSGSTNSDSTVSQTSDAGSTGTASTYTHGNGYGQQMRQSFRDSSKLTEVLAQLSSEERSALGQTADELVLQCQFSGYYCSKREFYQMYSPFHGNCYVFNSGWGNTSGLQKIKHTGRRYGLQLTLNIGQREYIRQASDLAGVLALVHPPDQMPFPEDDGILVRPGEFTSIALRKKTIHRAPEPYGTCIHKDEAAPAQNAYRQLLPVNYSTTACIRTCYQNNVISTCGCADPGYPKSEEAFGGLTVSICTSSNVTQVNCQLQINQKYVDNKLECHCPNLCNEDNYLPVISRAVWPAIVNKRVVLERLQASDPELYTSYDLDHTYSDNLMKVVIYYQELNYESIMETPAYDNGKFISDIGGILSLWVGFSFMTIFEFVEFFLDMSWYVIRRPKHKSRIIKVESKATNANLNTPPQSDINIPQSSATK